MTTEKFAEISGIRNRMIVAEQDHAVYMNQLRGRIQQLRCDHRDPMGQLVERKSYGLETFVFCKLCDERLA